MSIKSGTFAGYLAASMLGGAGLVIGVSSVLVAQVPRPEPIAYVGHGAMFDSHGAEIVPTAAFIADAQSWYRAKLTAAVAPEQLKAFAEYERALKSGRPLAGQERLVIEQRAIDWLYLHSSLHGDARLGTKLSALRYQLSWKLPVLPVVAKGARMPGPWEGGRFALDPELQRKLDQLRPDAGAGGATPFLVTVNSGQAYLDECAGAQVPIPPPINQMDPNGTAGWKIQGEIPQSQQFIVQTPAQVRTYSSAQGMCIALPRFTDASKTTVALDGVICLSKITSHMCVWDNQMSGNGFSFPAGTKIPIGKPDTGIDPSGRYQAGGAELENGTGGVCTDCHAGENPYIVHPDAQLAGGPLFGDLGNTLPMFAPNRYVPHVAASWPQNDASFAGPLVPTVCSGCHVKGGAGRFPHLSNQLPGYCGTILKGAVAGLTNPPDGLNAPATMPQGSPGSQKTNPAVVAFRAYCNNAPDASSADLGDPHLTTVNAIHYNFQSAGEFVALRNSDSGFELQTRQTPIVTSFVPGADPYTGLQSCVSLNTAAALRVGARRVSYQPDGGEQSRMTLRIDGKVVSLPAGGIGLGGSARIANASAGGGIDVVASDGTHVIITPMFWSSQGYWYLNVDVLRTPALEGTMGYIHAGDWLPLAPNGASFGAMPAGLPARWTVLDHSFADAWRVKAATSLFDYAPGTSPATFDDPNWPAKPGGACSAAPGVPAIPAPGRPPIRPMEKEQAALVCRPVIKDRAAYDACLFDATVMGDKGVGEAYARVLAARLAAK